MTTQQKAVTKAAKSMNKKSVLTGTLVGSVVGATTSLLLAPKGGKELRQDLSQQSKTVVDKSKDLKDRTSKKSKQLLNPCTKTDSTTGEEVNKHQISTQVQDPLPAEQSEDPSASQKGFDTTGNESEDKTK